MHERGVGERWPTVEREGHLTTGRAVAEDRELGVEQLVRLAVWHP